jgi:hypothetical protein
VKSVELEVGGAGCGFGSLKSVYRWRQYRTSPAPTSFVGSTFSRLLKRDNVFYHVREGIFLEDLSFADPFGLDLWMSRLFTAPPEAQRYYRVHPSLSNLAMGQIFVAKSQVA